jgi:hypothetical protein
MYFFEQIKSSYVPGAKRYTVHQIQSSALWVMVNEDPKSVFCHYTGMYKNKGSAYDESFFKAQREKGYRTSDESFFGAAPLTRPRFQGLNLNNAAS